LVLLLLVFPVGGCRKAVAASVCGYGTVCTPAPFDTGWGKQAWNLTCNPNTSNHCPSCGGVVACDRPPNLICNVCQQDAQGDWSTSCGATTKELLYMSIEHCECQGCTETPNGLTRKCLILGPRAVGGWRSQPCDLPPVGCTGCLADPDNVSGPQVQVCFTPGKGIYELSCCYKSGARSWEPCAAVIGPPAR
jgi:hypothetical protein